MNFEFWFTKFKKKKKSKIAKKWAGSMIDCLFANLSCISNIPLIELTVLSHTQTDRQTCRVGMYVAITLRCRGQNEQRSEIF